MNKDYILLFILNNTLDEPAKLILDVFLTHTGHEPEPQALYSHDLSIEELYHTSQITKALTQQMLFVHYNGAPQTHDGAFNFKQSRLGK